MFQQILITATIYSVVVISYERERAMTAPLRDQVTFRICMVFILTFSVATNLPKFLEFRVR